MIYQILFCFDILGRTNYEYIILQVYILNKKCLALVYSFVKLWLCDSALKDKIWWVESDG